MARSIYQSTIKRTSVRAESRGRTYRFTCAPKPGASGDEAFRRAKFIANDIMDTVVTGAYLSVQLVYGGHESFVNVAFDQIVDEQELQSWAEDWIRG